MNYEQTLDYLFAKLPMFSRVGSTAIKTGLGNTIALCDFLNNPQKKFKTVHVAGTNGKGSVSHMLAAILQTAGYKTGLYTSPHLKDFRERIKVNGEMISKEFVTDFTEKIKPVVETIEPSFFEITVAMAFDYFASQEIDIAVIEVGLGGRLDSTNIIIPEISVITNIGWDHMNLLGDSLDKIAYEKAGIIKREVPVVIGESIAETRLVFETVAAEHNAPLFIASEKREVMNWKWEKHELIAETAEKNKVDHQVFYLDL
ncbi:MAG: bifunctional folylpolyglutamate synthase/dihydrofolate synthase, partial [Bacteroidetes bacterium]|nr:bifunctional folylpolyglutamate synthase/dihydrofolate synthase [Bacteroidota bacterium]